MYIIDQEYGMSVVKDIKSNKKIYHSKHFYDTIDWIEKNRTNKGFETWVPKFILNKEKINLKIA